MNVLLALVLAVPAAQDFLAWAFPGTLTTTTLNATSATVGGVPIGSGLVDTVDVAGLDSRVVALESDPIVDRGYHAAFYSDGSDGDFTCTSSTHTSGPLVSGVLTRAARWNNLTVQSGCVIQVSGTTSGTRHVFQVYVAGTLDLSAAPAGWLKVLAAQVGPSGSGAGSSGAGSVSSAISQNPQWGISSSTGGGGANALSTNGSNAPTLNNALHLSSAVGCALGGQGGGVPSAGTTGGAGGPLERVAVHRLVSPLAYARVSAFGAIRPSCVGTGGGGGATSASALPAAAGGSGGAAGDTVVLAAYSIVTAGGTTAPGVVSNGGAGGAGGTASQTNCGGGGGGGGGSGGRVFIFTRSSGRTGSPVAAYFTLTGGAGGAGGGGNGSGQAGSAGGGGYGGGVTRCYTDTGVCSDQEPNIAPSGATPGSNTSASF